MCVFFTLNQRIKPYFFKHYFNKLTNSKNLNWFIFTLLSFIWGSSFILMKEGLKELTAVQVASLRIVTAGLALLPIAAKALKSIPKKTLWVIFLAGSMGSLIPAYLFCLAEENLDSALAGVLNSLTPIFVLLIGALFFQQSFSSQKIIGIAIAFAGTVLLSYGNHSAGHTSSFLSIAYIILATVLYGTNVNVIKKHLWHIPSGQLAATGLLLNAIPALIVLTASGFFGKDFSGAKLWAAIGFTSILGVIGTAVASVIFYMLIKRAGIVFSSMVTYAIPIVAIVWGIIYGEKIGWLQVLCFALILFGVFFANTSFNFGKNKHED